MGDVIFVDFKKEKRRRKWKKKKEKFQFWWKFKRTDLAWAGIFFSVLILLMLLTAKSCVNPYRATYYDSRIIQP